MQRRPSCSTTYSAGGEQNLVGCGSGCASRTKKQSTQCNEESKQPRRALVMIVMYIAAKVRSPDSSSRYLIDWGNSSRKADRAEKFTSQCDSSWAGHARSIARITRRFISGHMVRSSDAGMLKVEERESRFSSRFSRFAWAVALWAVAASNPATPRKRADNGCQRPTTT